MKYTKDHEWVLVEGDVATVGVTEYAQEALGDVVFVELPQNNVAFAQGDEVGVVESVKAAAEVYAPLSGTIVDANPNIENDPSLVNTDAEGVAWFFKMSIANASELDALMDEAAYTAFCEGQ